MATGGYGPLNSTLGLFMRAENFEISQGIYITVAGVLLDLHNAYDFIGISQDIPLRQATLSWSKASTATNGLPSTLSILFQGVNHLHVLPRDPSKPYTEDTCLNSMGYRCDEPWAEGQFWTEAQPEEGWRWSFEFMSGAEIVIGSSRARAATEP